MTYDTYSIDQYLSNFLHNPSRLRIYGWKLFRKSAKKKLKTKSDLFRAINNSWEAILSNIIYHLMFYMSTRSTTFDQYKGSITKF